MTKLLAYFPSPAQGVWHVGPLPIRAYALFIIAGIVAALLIGDRRWEARGGERGVIYDIALWTVPFGLIGGRLYHLATDWRTYWGPGGAGLGAAIRIWDGGLGIWGAVALGGVGAWIGCRRHGIPLPAFADAIAPGIILAQAIGRLGNYFNQELYGRETTLPWGLEIFYRRDPSGYIDPHSLDGISTGQVALVVQPTFLYELLWNLLIFAVLIYADRRFTLGHGRLFALYVAGYCVGRFCVELLRDDTATHIAGIRINSFTSTFVFIGAVVYIMAAPRGREDPESLRGNQYVDEESAELEPATVAATAGAAGTTAAAGGGDDDVPTESAVGTAAVADADEAQAEEPQSEAVAEEAEAEQSEAEAEESEAEELELDEPEAAAEAEAPQGEEADAAVADTADAEESEGDAEEPEAEAVADEAEAEESEAEELELDEPEVATEVEAPQAEADEAVAEGSEGDADEPEAEAVADEAEAEESEAEELELDEPESEAEAEAPQPEPADEAEDEEPEAESAEATTEEPVAEKISDQPETRRRWGSRLRNRLSGR
ncbi:prolipoprotein diacylglyceryl transferase [Mycobacterium intracellulare]|uniref:Phosphatidylglycerol--prolipoprotein diacylglyceryl transferase n=1 Tax=Mycobacterium intracellulare (strain ATCC 13950 / DSM 43223 / JCM 6384 / NCTC 13025 / 3600) TaxID=487521 RepID=H8IQM5_MYCIA|nr:prolipoprotein diacylglyceryl transferase [Mycobacterium intracellulare]AFC44224.1 prolipoprotein diacylglyceryl transferase [Mycobacterium intracellulare ATCC 13950]ASW96008.1 prolipoprotein diacylglyceryl transferase [Mycobacterium intracellulare]MCA2231141.1 prolipoprotein diacylglyceryl transferase [Mycobacterium intracellulare]MCA2273378.1 prolipoprotein diacylglyceryl transferase [Mycobacterium intracellulare]MCA2304181.1 prolipoprotein diacylglyceryl transferase [Mycobacterium intrac